MASDNASMDLLIQSMVRLLDRFVVCDLEIPKKLEDDKKLQEGTLQGKDIPEEDRDYYLERRYPAFGNLVPRD